MGPLSDDGWLRSLADRPARAQGCLAAAARCGVDGLLVFAPDPLGVMLPAPGFPQTLRNGASWRPLLAPPAVQGRRTGTVESPYTGRPTQVVVESCGDLLVAFLGGKPADARVQELAAMAPLLSRLFEAEHHSATQAAQAATVRETADRMAVLARHLDDANTRLEAAVSSRDQTLTRLELLNTVGQRLASEHDLPTLVQLVTDAATRASGAEFGAFFYNLRNEAGESYTLYTLSGAPPEAFSKFPLPRKTQVFAPTFDGVGVVRSDDIRKDPRYGKSGPHFGMPRGHLPVVSYLAVPVISRSDEVLGGLFFGSRHPAVFGDAEQAIVEGLAAQAAVAIDNARLYERLQQSIQARDDFLSLASHELRTPLTTLALQTDFRLSNLRRGRLDSFQPKNLEKLLEGDRRQFGRLTRLVDDMLDIARINAGRLEIHPEPIELAGVVTETLERHQDQIAGAGVEVRFQAEGQTDGRWDRLRIEQVFTNLLTNALKYAPRRPLDIQVRGSAEGVTLTVRDHGEGIPAKHQSRIFQRFERAVSGNEVSGLGLGLYIVKQLVERHGGRIDMRSSEGRGAEFIVTLPRSPAATSTAPVAREA